MTARLLQFDLDGEWVSSTGEATIDVVNPTTAAVVAQVPSGTVEDIDRAVAAARRAFDAWSQTPVTERARVLRDVSGEISERSEEIAQAAATDIGTPLAVGRSMHAELPASTFADMADRVERFEFEKRDGSLTIVREPVGVVGAITPWNYPVHQIAAKVAPALAAGCTVVVKPSEVAPLTAWLLAQILDGVGLPARRVQHGQRPRPRRWRSARAPPRGRHGEPHGIGARRHPRGRARRPRRQAGNARARRQVA